MTAIGFSGLNKTSKGGRKNYATVHGERGLAQFFGKLMENAPLKVAPKIRA
jgi:hypothetical protein